MSCSSSNAPIDISSSNSSGKCDLKCDYKFNYQTSSCIGKNMGDYISLSYDNTSSSIITFNLSSYSVKELRLYYPSLHSFNGNKLDGELIVVHTSSIGEIPLLVCIPIKISNSTSISATFFSNIINSMAKNAPAEGDSTTIQMSNYNLNRIVPKSPFYSYTATEPYQPCSEKVNYVVYDASEICLDIPQKVYDKLKEIVKENYYTVKKEVSYFYNAKGANTSLEDDIYIDCKPVGQSDETTMNITESSTNSDNSSYTIDDLKNNSIFQLLVSIIIFLIILYLFNGILKIFKIVGSNTSSVMDYVKPT